MTTDAQLIYVQLNKIVAQADGLVKDKQNKQQGWNFRGVDDAYNYLHDIFKEHHVFTIPRVMNIDREERATKAGGVLIYTILTMEYDFLADDGSKVTACVIGEAMDTSDKSCNKAMSVAHKMALFQITMLPTLLSADPDGAIPEPASKIPEKQEPETPMAIRDQLAAISDFRAEHKTTMEENDYIDGQGERLTYKQADQLISRIKAREDEK
jgi:ERF superfamily